MAVDVRCTVTCSLGTLISGNIADDYVQGNGLILVRGSVEIAGLITPAIGTVVTFAYKRNGGTRAIPRKLRVLSSFADPLRRSTRVELGCKLSYLSSLREEIKWTAFNDPANSGLTKDDAKIITIPIRASSIIAQCLSVLGITASSNPLTNKFSVAEFDFSAGYVAVLNDLLISECYCGYLDYNEVLQVINLNQEGGSGSVVTVNEIIDIAAINAGQLPGEAVTVSYSSLVLSDDVQQSDPSGNNAGNKTAWTYNQSTNPSAVIIPWGESATGDPKTAVFNILETTTSETDYGEIVTKDGQTQRLAFTRTTRVSTQSPAVIGRQFSEYYSNNISISSSEISKQSVETFTYDAYGREVFWEKYERGGLAYLVGGINVPVAFSSTDYVSFLPNQYIDLGRETRETIYVNESSQVTTRTYGHWFRTIQGQQAIAEGRLSFTSAAQVSDYINSLINIGLIQVESRTDIQIAGTVASAPTTAEINNAANAKGGNAANNYRTEAKSSIALALGSATAQRRTEFSLPYAPDDTFIKTGSTYGTVKSDAEVKAKNFGRVQNRLLLGNRNGMNLQLSALHMPEAPFSPLVVNLNGLSGLYRTNATSWTINPEGLVVSTDALFWGAVGGSGDFWFPVAPGITSLPTTPPTTTVNVTGLDASGNTVAIGTQTQTTANTLVKPYNETVVLAPTTRTRAVITSLPYALEATTALTATTKTKAVLRKQTWVFPPAAGVTVAGVAPRVSTGVRLLVPAAAVEVTAPVPLVASGASVPVPAAGVTIAAVAPDQAGRLKTVVNVPVTDVQVAGLAPKVSRGARVVAPAVDIAVAALVPSNVGITDPTPGLSPVLWYDFSDSSTVTVSSSQITQITDKGSRGWTLTKSSTGPAYGSGINSKNCVDWGNGGHSNYLRNTSSTSTNIAEIYVVLDANFGSTFPNYNGLVTSTDASSWYAAVGGFGTAGFYAGTFDAAYINGSATNQYSGSILTTINSPALLRIKRVNDTALATTTGFQLGNDRSNGSRGWGGLVGEVIVFTAPLSSTNRTSLQNWLAKKWNLTLS